MRTLPYFGLYVVTCPGREQVLTRTISSIRASDWPDAPAVLAQPPDWPIGWESTSRMYRSVLQRAWNDGCWWAVVLEDDVRVNRHLWANLTRWHPITTGQLHWGSLFIPDTIQAPWARACPELGYRLARSALATGPHAEWQKARLWGSQAYVFSRGGLGVMLDAWDRHGGGQDARAVAIAAGAGWPLWFADPCLVEHAPGVSAFGTPPAYAPDFDAELLLSRPAVDSYQHPEGVPGWLSYAEGRALWELARGKRVLELGRFHGRSTVALAQSAREVVSVDVTDPEIAAGWLERLGAADRVALHRGTFVAVVPRLGEFDLVFVDGEHDAANVRADVELALSVLAPGGVLACHDYPDPAWPDVRRVIDEIAAARGLVRIRQADYLGAFRFSHRALDKTNEAQRPTDGVVRAAKSGSTPRTIWMYWEGPMPGYIDLCIRTVRAHNTCVELLDRAGFDALFRHDRDLNIDALPLATKSDFIRSYLLAHHGGMYLDADCVVLGSLDSVFDLADQSGFVGHRDPLGYANTNFMASVAGGAVIRDHYRRVCETIRSGQPIGWLDLASVPMDQALAAHPNRFHLLPTARVMPLSWQETDRLAHRCSDAAHAIDFRADALCYMLSNNTIRQRRTTRVLTYMPPADLLADSYFLSFLFRQALGHKPSQPPIGCEHLGGHEALNQFDEGAFDYLVDRCGIRTMIDVGCGPPGMVYYAERQGVRAVGVDGDPLVARSSRVVIEHDYTRKPLYAGEFDLGWSVEFVEHVEDRFLPNVMATLRGCRFVFLTAAVPSQPGHHHVNCRLSEYWIEQFRRIGFAPDAVATKGVRQHSTMESGFTRNAGLVFRRV
jgi:SAM-dependent methyltransferase